MNFRETVGAVYDRAFSHRSRKSLLCALHSCGRMSGRSNNRKETPMKIHPLLAFPVSVLILCTAALAQTPGETDSHIGAAKAAAGLDFRGTFINLCLLGAAPGGARGGAGRGANGAPATPDRAGWYASPYKVFDNLYWLGTRQHSSWALM